MPKEYRESLKTLVAILVIALVILGSAGAFLLMTPPGDDSGKLKVVTTFYPLYYLANEIGGDRAEVHMLIPDNVEPHSWEPSPSDLIKVSEAEVMVYNGVGFEPWMDNLLTSINNPDLVLVDTSEDVSLIPSETIIEPYEDALDLLDMGPNVSLLVSVEESAAPYVGAEPKVLDLSMADIIGGKGGYFKLNVSESADYRLLVTSEVQFSLTYLNGTEVEIELQNGAISWYPQFSSSKFFELQAGVTFLVNFAPTSVATTKMVVVQMDVLAEGQADEGHEHGLNDPHFWLDPLSAKVQVQNILTAFQQADPGNSTYYGQNAADLSGRLDLLHQAFDSGLRDRTKDAIVTTHEGFNYIAFRYGFEAYAAIGISADQQPSPQDLVRLSDTVTSLDLNYVFSEPVFSDAVMETIASETGAQVLVLDGLHGRTGVHSDMDYFEIMYANLESLKKGLEVSS